MSEQHIPEVVVWAFRKGLMIGLFVGVTLGAAAGILGAVLGASGA